MKTLHFKLRGEPLWICDMRPGISEDGVRLKLPAGEYQCEIAPCKQTGLSTISYVRAGARPTSERRAGKVSLDMARVGVVEIAPLLSRHSGNWEALADWSDEAADKRGKKWGGTLVSGDHHAAFFNIGSDCTLDVFHLRQGGRDVGLALRPQARPVPREKPQRWTWVEVKLRGIGKPWSFCDDWASAPDDELILSHIEFELSYFTENEIDHRAPLAAYSPKLTRIEGIKVFVEDSGTQRRSITGKIATPKIPSPLTSRAIAAAVLEIFKLSRKAVPP